MAQKLVRIRKNKMIGGVAAGLSEYFDVDVVFIRLTFVLTTFFGGAGFLAYIVLWIITPEKYDYEQKDEDEQETDEINEEKKNKKSEEVHDRGTLGAFVLIGLGLFFLADYQLSFIHLHHIFPLILIGIGVAILLNYRRN